ncbi:thioredoxin family protein [Paenibacillus sp. FSL H8-0537]|uniref:thioredoxin family protein n=1 Tax=Paenibacillus sp. FSL H8-0537 TaxID=2921399 RepID=UPI00310132FC
MLKTEQQYFEEGKPIQSYMDVMSSLKNESFSVYNQFEISDYECIQKIKVSKFHFLVITEDWCGDAMMINPIIRKITEAANLEMRVALRDSNVELIDRYLTNGGRAIPIVIILDSKGEVVGKWGPRAPKVQEIVDNLRAILPDKEDPSFADKQKEVFGSLRNRYAQDPFLWSYVYDSFKETILAISDK